MDAMVSEYQQRPEGKKAPIGLGISSQNKPDAFGTIAALRRAGTSLQGQFTNIDPRVEHLYGRGVLPKKSIQVKRSPEGISLQRVGLVHPVHRDYWRDNETPDLEDLMKQTIAAKDHVFADLSKGYIEVEQLHPRGMELRANEVIADLKARGMWTPRFDDQGIPLIFSGLEGTPLLCNFVEYLEVLMEKGDPTSTLLSERAQYFARSRGVSFDEALTKIMEKRPTTGDPLTDAARALQKEMNVSFSEALDLVVSENPALLRS
ncbi:MAG: hypothetical protein WBQ94_18125 [Terracidiphilus sp.]